MKRLTYIETKTQYNLDINILYVDKISNYTKNIIMKIFIALFTLIFSFSIGASAQAEKTLVKSLPIETSTIALSLPGKVTISEWDKDFARLTTSVQLKNFNETILKRLTEVGRYELISNTENGQLLLTMPKVAKQVTIKEVKLKEVFEFTIMVPKGVTVEFLDQEGTGSSL